ncbi:MAG: RND transporter [Candidatus Electrothrix sp. GW3-4]|uniref:RND transporter n=1 Tax=Candidatus Electrothrix sp. GW3-4 TaxID=3126740 RepID=UPI0030D56D13
MRKVGEWLDILPWAPLLVVALVVGGAPFLPEPHLVEKMRMVIAGTLKRPIDIFDFFYHGLPLALLFFKLIRLVNRMDKKKSGR